MRKNLVLARAGAASLHPEWLEGATERSWDLRLAPYQELAPQDGLDCEVGPIVAGPKWSGIREVLNGWDGWREYDRVWLPDDDIRVDAATIDRMFEVAEALGLDLFAPALDERSYYAHFITMRNPRFLARRVGFVEIMVPGFSRPALERLLPTLDLTETGWGWGLDSLWPQRLGYENVGVIDGTPVAHTRPVGRMYDEALRRRVFAESDAVFERFGCRQRHVTFGGFGDDLRPLELSPEQLLAELVRGWDHLIERDPRVLSWVADFQRSHFAPPPYPIEGTPDVVV